ncbi:MAG: energy transducer TonB [Roseibacillus sp.]
MSCPSPHPDGWFGRDKSKPVDLNLVESKPIKSCEARPFPFWLSSLIASAALSIATVGLHSWILPGILVEPEFDAPVIGITRLVDKLEVVEEVVSESPSLTRTPPVAPQLIMPIPMPALQAEIPRGPEPPLDRIEPYDSGILVELDPEGSSPLRKKVVDPPQSESKPKARSQARSVPDAIPVQGPSQPARVLRRYQPDYPRTARRDKVEGRVMLDVQIGSRGRVGSVRILNSSGSPLLDSTAIAAVKRWSFSPAMKNGKPVSSRVHVPFRFSLQ